MQIRIHLTVVFLISCVQIFDEKCMSTAQTVANPQSTTDRLPTTQNPMVERINQIRATLMALLQNRVTRLQQQLASVNPSTNAITSLLSPFAALQQLPRPYIAQTLISSPPVQPGGGMWLAQAGIVVPQPGASPGAQPLAFRPIAQFALNAPTTQQLAAAVAPLAAQLGATLSPAALAAALPLLSSPVSTLQNIPGLSLGQPLGVRPGLATLGQLLGATLPIAQPGSPLAQPLGATFPIPRPGITTLGQLLAGNQPITQPGAALTQPLGATIPIVRPGVTTLGQLLGATQPNAQLGAALAQPLGAALPLAQTGAALAKPLGSNLPPAQTGAPLAQPLGSTLPLAQTGAALAQPLGSTLPLAQTGAALAQPLGTSLPTTPLGAALGLPSLSRPTLPTTQPGQVVTTSPVAAAVPLTQLSSPLLSQAGVAESASPTGAPTSALQATQANGQTSSPSGQTGNSPQEVNVIPVPQPTQQPGTVQTQETLSSPTPTAQPITPSGPIPAPNTQLDDRSKPLLLV